MKTKSGPKKEAMPKSRNPLCRVADSNVRIKNVPDWKMGLGTRQVFKDFPTTMR